MRLPLARIRELNEPQKGAMSPVVTRQANASGSEHSATELPRVLIVYLSCINDVDQHGVSLRSWFAEWPRERLAQVYSGNERGDERFCEHNFRLGSDERRLGRFFFKLRGSSLAEGAGLVVLDQRDQGDPHPPGRLVSLRRRVSRLLVNSGLWEIIFRPRLSSRLLAWVNRFDPQVIYCQGYSLSFAWLPLMLQRKLGIPICFQTGDDWPTYLYRDSFIRWAVRPLVQRSALALVRSASIRFANSDSMAVEYAARYGESFEPIWMCDNIERFRVSEPRHVVGPGELSVVYTGSLAQDRWVSILDLCHAATALRRVGLNIVVSVFASMLPPEAVNRLQNVPSLQIMPPLSHEELPCVLKGADLLFLPETLDSVKAQDIHLSISTKAHLYMMSERPVLVYGSPIAGVVDYAKRGRWAYVVERNDRSLLTEALHSLLTNDELRHQLVQRGVEVALQNHDERVVRARFSHALQDSVRTAVGRSSREV